VLLEKIALLAGAGILALTCAGVLLTASRLEIDADAIPVQRGTPGCCAGPARSRSPTLPSQPVLSWFEELKAKMPVRR
jgi:hypothetical protein